MGEKETQVIKVAQELFVQQPDWVTFFREVLALKAGSAAQTGVAIALLKKQAPGFSRSDKCPARTTVKIGSLCQAGGIARPMSNENRDLAPRVVNDGSNAWAGKAGIRSRSSS